MFNLAMAYWSGTGRDADDARYFEWTRKAAGAGDTRGKFNLALAYEVGKGVEVDPNKYLEWLLSAAEDGEPAAMFNAALCYEDGVGTTKDLASYFAWMRRAAESGHLDAMFLTALAYYKGRGTAIDEEGFEAWVTRAADAGHRQALIAGRLAHLKSRGVIDSAQRGALGTAFHNLLAAVRSIKNHHIVGSAPDGVIYSASWSALTAMLPRDEDAAPMANHVRLYNVAYCTDAWEGRRLTELDDDDALLLGSFLGAAPAPSDGGPETDYAVYLASFNLGAVPSSRRYRPSINGARAPGPWIRCGAPFFPARRWTRAAATAPSIGSSTRTARPARPWPGSGSPWPPSVSSATRSPSPRASTSWWPSSCARCCISTSTRSAATTGRPGCW
jgi:TPR repeat protein